MAEDLKPYAERIEALLESLDNEFGGVPLTIQQCTAVDEAIATLRLTIQDATKTEESESC